MSWRLTVKINPVAGPGQDKPTELEDRIRLAIVAELPAEARDRSVIVLDDPPPGHGGLNVGFPLNA